MKNDWTKLLFTGLAIVMINVLAHAQKQAEGYKIKVKLSEFNQDTLLLGYHLGEKTYIKDTAVLDKASGMFVFEDSKKLEPGVYLVVMPPENNYFQVMVNEKEQNFTYSTSTQALFKAAKVVGSKDNEAFIRYMNFLADKRAEAEAAGKLKETNAEAAQKKFEALDKEVRAYQLNFAKTEAGTVASVLVKGAIEIEMPAFEDLKNDPSQLQTAQYYYYKQHYFDFLDLNEEALLRTPILHQKLDYYVEKLTVPQPDSIIQALDFLFAKMHRETFEFYFIQYLNKYAKSNLVGFDAVYVHLAQRYIETGQLKDVIEADNQKKIIENARKLAPILIGKKAPDIKVFKEDNSTVTLSEIKAQYTVLFFFAPDCGHCQKQTPDLVAFAKKMKEKNIDVKVLATCTYLGVDKMPECWKYVKEKGFDNIITTVDPYLTSRYKTLYNVETTPQVFVLDENKIIRSKSIEAKQIEEVIDFLIKEKEAASKSK